LCGMVKGHIQNPGPPSLVNYSKPGSPLMEERPVVDTKPLP